MAPKKRCRSRKASRRGGVLSQATSAFPCTTIPSRPCRVAHYEAIVLSLLGVRFTVQINIASGSAPSYQAFDTGQLGHFNVPQHEPAADLVTLNGTQLEYYLGSDLPLRLLARPPCEMRLAGFVSQHRALSAQTACFLHVPSRDGTVGAKDVP